MNVAALHADRKDLNPALFGAVLVGASVAVPVGTFGRRRMPRWALPLIGGLLFATIVVLSLTSALWFFRTVGVEA